MLRLIRPRPRVPMTNIMLVDDNPLRASLRKSVLGRRHDDVVRVSDASEALCLVETAEVAQNLRLVITAHLTAGIPGPEFVAELRTRLPQVPVLVLGARAETANYEGIPGVIHSDSHSNDELRILVNALLLNAEKQTA